MNDISGSLKTLGFPDMSEEIEKGQKLIDSENAISKPKRGRKVKKVYYLEDFAGLWVYIQVGERAKLLTPFPFTQAQDKADIKGMIDDF